MWPEPFGIVEIEAMAYKLPVTACAVGGIPE
ncbi:MAG: glycosyltransferase [Deltaproteobacteria bacterium]|nr:glycosyltransferase [Deltaproteobacteria bacterium]